MKLLHKPFPAIRDRKQIFLSALAFGLFVGLFLGIFQPFGLHGVNGSLLLIAAGYGVITTLCMLLAQLFLPVIFPQFYDEDEWNTGREITQIMTNVMLIALANWGYSAALGFFAPDVFTLLQFLIFTALIGIFPVSIQVLMRQNNFQRRFSDSSALLNEQLSIRNPQASNSKNRLTIADENGKLALDLERDALLVAESADNYVKIYFESEGGLRHEMVRTSLSSLESLLANDPRFFRAHRSWLVNLSSIQKVSGNARGYTLKLPELQKEIPVARSRITEFDAAIRNI